MSSPSSESVFVSYSHHDHEFADKLVDWLRQQGFSVWVDRDGIDGGDQFLERIARGMNRADVVIPLLSRNSVASPWVVREVTYALERGKKIIPVFLEFAEIPETLEFAIAGLHRIDFSDGGAIEATWTALERALTRAVKSAEETSEAQPTGLPGAAGPADLAALWEQGGRRYSFVELYGSPLRRLLAASDDPVGGSHDAGPEALALLMLAAIHYGEQWGAWLERNLQNDVALDVLLETLGGGLCYLRPRFRALYSLQRFDGAHISTAIERRLQPLPADVRRIIRDYVLPERMEEYLFKVRATGDPSLAPKAAAVLHEIRDQFEQAGDEDSGLPVI
ncbi:MAG: toll/interleukin-1 receptor domain-containing protein [Acidobacteriota bacterium]|nr:MAG: toll/interleukin-1 receptor domain-containing protein [Acidobacteriota bacterium]